MKIWGFTRIAFIHFNYRPTAFYLQTNSSASYNFLTCIRQVTFAICRILLQVTGIGFLAVLFLTIFHFDAVNLLAESDVLSDLDWLQLPVCSTQSMIAERYLGSFDWSAYTINDTCLHQLG